ncbi:MAG: hypothetical protein AB2L07_10340 [Thermoanaerobaculaceae bacterium]
MPETAGQVVEFVLPVTAGPLLEVALKVPPAAETSSIAAPPPVFSSLKRFPPVLPDPE